MASRKSILYLFDVDGTLTKPRQVITKEFKEFLLEKVRPKVTLGIVSGSDYSKISEQMGGEVAGQLDYVFCENGVVHYKDGQLVSSVSILNVLGEELLQRVINFALGYMSKIELPKKRGNFIEFRCSMLNFCPMGRSCNQEIRDEFVKFDDKHKIRQKFCNALEEEFKDTGIKFALGGQTSVDVFPVGWDKTYCLNHVADQKFEEIRFFGDKTSPGGNDYEIYSDSRTIGHTVTSPDDTKQQLKKCLNIEE